MGGTVLGSLLSGNSTIWGSNSRGPPIVVNPPNSHPGVTVTIPIETKLLGQLMARASGFPRPLGGSNK